MLSAKKTGWLAICAALTAVLLVSSFPFVGVPLGSKSSGNLISIVSAQGDPCAGCDTAFDEWKKAKEALDNCIENPASCEGSEAKIRQAFDAASNKYSHCINLGCIGGEPTPTPPPGSEEEPDPCLRGYEECVWVWEGYDECLKECLERYNACKPAYAEYKILAEKYGKCLECIFRCDVPKEMFPGYMGTMEECLERYDACKQACHGDDSCLERCLGTYNACIKGYEDYEKFKAQCDAEYQSFCEGDAEILLQKGIAAKNKYVPLSTDMTCTAETEDTKEELKAYFEYMPIEPLKIEFDASRSTGNIKYYWWQFGEQEVKIWNGKVYYDKKEQRPTIQHQYGNQGSYEVLLKVEDYEGKSATFKRTISVGQDFVEITSIKAPQDVVTDEESEWKLEFKYKVVSVSDPTVHQGMIQLKIYDQDGKCLRDTFKEIYIGIGTYSNHISSRVFIPKSATELRFEVYLYPEGSEQPTARDKKFYDLQTPWVVKFSCDDAQPAELNSLYTVAVEIVDRKDIEGPWTYMFSTSAGSFLYPGYDELLGSKPHRRLFESTEKKVEVAWRSPESLGALELEYAKKIIAVNEAYARNLAATGASTQPVYGRAIKTVNDLYNLIDGLKTTGGHAGKTWEAMTRGEILVAIMHASNSGIEAIQTTAGAILLVPKATAPAGVKEIANAFTDSANAGIDYFQVNLEALTEYAQGSKVMPVTLFVKVTNQEGDEASDYITVELQY